MLALACVVVLALAFVIECGPHGLHFGLPQIPPSNAQTYDVTFNWSGYALLEMGDAETEVAGN